MLEVIRRAAQQQSVGHRVRKPLPRLHHVIIHNTEALHEQLQSETVEREQTKPREPKMHSPYVSKSVQD